MGTETLSSFAVRRCRRCESDFKGPVLTFYITFFFFLMPCVLQQQFRHKSVFHPCFSSYRFLFSMCYRRFQFSLVYCVYLSGNLYINNTDLTEKRCVLSLPFSICRRNTKYEQVSHRRLFYSCYKHKVGTCTTYEISACAFNLKS